MPTYIQIGRGDEMSDGPTNNLTESKVTLVSELTDAQIDQLMALYRNEFWCNHRRRPDVVKMLAHTDIVIGAVDDEENLVGFVRVLTDYVYKATIYDVIVRPDWRGKQLGRLLMDSVINHPELKDVLHFDLYCLPKMHDFYERWDFKSDVGEITHMRRINRSS